MTSFITQAIAREHVNDLIAHAQEARLRRDLRRARRQFRNARRQALGPGLESGVATSEPLTGARWGMGPAVAR